MSVTERKPVLGAEECVFTLVQSRESVCERKPVCAFPE
jgi:hypothetical protein